MKRSLVVTICLWLGSLSASAFSIAKIDLADSLSPWKNLLTGNLSASWKGYNQSVIPPSWSIDNGVLALNPVRDKKGMLAEGGDLVTLSSYKNFELELDWKISAHGNSGVMFNVVEDPRYSAPYLTGPEIQILDNDGHRDGTIQKHRAGDLYDLVRSEKETVKAVGSWNHVRIVSNRGHLTIYLNGYKSVEIQLHTPAWDALIAGSKFSKMPDFGKADQGKICLQDHGNQVFFKNIRIKILPS